MEEKKQIMSIEDEEMEERSPCCFLPVAAGESSMKDQLRKRLRLHEAIIQGSLFVCGIISIFTTIGIVFFLGREALLSLSGPECNPARISDGHQVAASDQ